MHTLTRRLFLQAFAAWGGAIALGCSDDPANNTADDTTTPLDTAPDTTDTALDTADPTDTAPEPDTADATDDTADTLPPASDLPHLGGAPNTSEGRTIAAFVDSIIPGAHRDPTGAVGGIDAQVPALFFDPELPALPLVPLLVLLIDSASRQHFAGRKFAQLSPDERDVVVAQAMQDIPQLEFAMQLVKLGYFSSPLTATHLGYPGGGGGYSFDPQLSFFTPMSSEITPDGNYP